MGPLGVIEPDPVFDHGFGLESVLQFLQIDGFLFEGSPPPFDEDIVEVTATPIHGSFDIGLGQGRDPGRTRELRSLIRIHDLRLAVFCNSFLQRLDTKAGEDPGLRSVQRRLDGST